MCSKVFRFHLHHCWWPLFCASVISKTSAWWVHMSGRRNWFHFGNAAWGKQVASSAPTGKKNNSLDEFFMEYKHGFYVQTWQTIFPPWKRQQTVIGTEPGTEELIFWEESKGPLRDRDSSWEQMYSGQGINQGMAIATTWSLFIFMQNISICDSHILFVFGYYLVKYIETWQSLIFCVKPVF